MKPTFYYLATCNTCQKILKEMSDFAVFELREIKSQPISEAELLGLQQKSGNYETLFSKRSQQYRIRNLQGKALSETDIKALILDHYTFLKRPIITHNKEIFIGNEKNVFESANNYFKKI